MPSSALHLIVNENAYVLKLECNLSCFTLHQCTEPSLLVLNVLFYSIYFLLLLP